MSTKPVKAYSCPTGFGLPYIFRNVSHHCSGDRSDPHPLQPCLDLLGLVGMHRRLDMLVNYGVNCQYMAFTTTDTSTYHNGAPNRVAHLRNVVGELGALIFQMLGVTDRAVRGRSRWHLAGLLPQSTLRRAGWMSCLAMRPLRLPRTGGTSRPGGHRPGGLLVAGPAAPRTDRGPWPAWPRTCRQGRSGMGCAQTGTT